MQFNVCYQLPWPNSNEGFIGRKSWGLVVFFVGYPVLHVVALLDFEVESRIAFSGVMKNQICKWRYQKVIRGNEAPSIPVEGVIEVEFSIRPNLGKSVGQFPFGRQRGDLGLGDETEGRSADRTGNAALGGKAVVPAGSPNLIRNGRDKDIVGGKSSQKTWVDHRGVCIKNRISSRLKTKTVRHQYQKQFGAARECPCPILVTLS